MPKTATLPPVRISPATRRSLRKLLRNNETVSSFVADAVTEKLVRRTAQAEFLARGIANAKEAKQTGEYVSAEDALERLDAIIKKGRAGNK